MNSLTLDQSVVRYGDSVTFTVTTDATPTSVRVKFSKDGVVHTEAESIFHFGTGTYTARPGRCDSPNWPVGTGADAKAELIDQHGKKPKTLATATFVVLPVS